MKLKKWAMAASLVMWLPIFVTSCNTDDTPVKGSAVVRINAAALYEKLGITDLVGGKLSQGEMTVTDSVLVYDQKGQLVARLGTESSQLQTVSIGLEDLPVGTYTLVAWQTTSDGPWADPFWWLTGADALATARIVQNYPSSISGFRAIGMSSVAVTVGGEPAVVEADIKPMGSVLDLSVDGLTEKSDYSYVRLSVQGDNAAVDGFYLDPARSGEDRWVFSGSRKESGLPLAGVLESSGDNKVFTLLHGENKDFTLIGTHKSTKEKESLIDAALTLEAGTVATFYFNLERASFQPPYFGPTAGFAAWKADRDAGKLVSDPCIQWGVNLQAVHEHVVKHQLWWDYYIKDLEEVEGHGWGLWYSVAKNLYEYYSFEDQNGNNLLNAICICMDPDVPREVPFVHLVRQGYEFKGVISYPDRPEEICPVFLSPDGKIEVLICDYYDGCWEIFYQPTDPEDLPRIIPAVG
jgi:hypothetical protein